MNTASLYQPLNDMPQGFSGAHRYVHVIGTSVFVDDRPDDDSWSRHFVGIVEGVGWWAVDVPVDSPDPSYGAAIDLRNYFGVATAAEWLAAGRAVQTAEWVRTHRYCGRCSTPTEPSAGERGLKCPSCGLLAYPPRGSGDDHTGDTWAGRPRPGSAARPRRKFPDADVLVPGWIC